MPKRDPLNQLAALPEDTLLELLHFIRISAKKGMSRDMQHIAAEATFAQEARTRKRRPS
jgi:hypothetical protein